MKNSSSNAESDPLPYAIVYFDGYCNVCNRFVDFLLRRDSRGRLRFASIQGKTAEQRLPRELTERVETMAYEYGGKVGGTATLLAIESGAAIRSIAALGGMYALMSVFLVVPSFLRDAVYRWVANHRYLWFGKRNTCRIASPEERARFLD